eukprot:scaffold68_cov340-Pavlova_lutheri.AAC.46
MGRWRGSSRGCSTWIPESKLHALPHSVHIVGGVSSKLSHAHDEASTDTAWFSGTTSSSAVENKLPQRDPAPLFSRILLRTSLGSSRFPTGWVVRFRPGIYLRDVRGDARVTKFGEEGIS